MERINKPLGSHKPQIPGSTPGHRNITGIYALFWEQDDSVYIGQSVNIDRRFKEHLKLLSAGTHTNYKVKAKYLELGLPELVILELCDIVELNSKEVFWTAEFDSINTGLNIIEAGTVGYGPKSNASIYSKTQVLKVFSMLYRGYTNTDVVNRVKVSKSLVSDIRLGNSHLWLSGVYPTQYREMQLQSPEQVRVTISKKLGTVPSIISPEGTVYQVPNVREFCRTTGEAIFGLPERILNVSISRLISGTRKQYRGWKLLTQN